ncbi:MAG: YhdP family protein, partial [Rudaea sp.]
MGAARHGLRRARLWISGLFAALVIFMGVIVGLTQLALPWIAAHPEKVSAMLSERMHRPVVIDRLAAHWERNGPVLDLGGVHLGIASAGSGATQPLTVASAAIKVNFFAWARRNASWTEFRVAGIDLDVARDAKGNWQLRGMETADGGEHDLDDSALFSLGTLVLRDVKLGVTDEASGRHSRFSADELRLINHGDSHRALARVKCIDTGSPPIDVVIDYDSGTHAGHIYLGGQGLDLAALSRNAAVSGLLINRGNGNLRLWLTLSGGEVTETRIEAELADIVLTTNTAIAPDAAHQIVPHIAFDRIAFGARWQRDATGWAIDIADLAITRQGSDIAPGNLHVRARSRGADAAPEYAAEVDGVDLSSIASIAMLLDIPPPSLRRWLYAGNPEGSLAVGRLRYVDAQDYDVVARFEALAWHAYARLPSVYGLSGILRGDQDAMSVELPQHNDVAVSVPHVFRQALEFSELSGDVAIYRNDDAWRIETDALAFEGSTPGKSYGGELRGSVDVPDDGRRPGLDVAALVTHAEVQASHLFWPVNIMPPAAVAWLDRGLDAGRVTSGRAVFRGDLDDWPFRNNAGRFDAVAEIDDLRVKYLGDWPALEHAHANLGFVNTSLHIDVTGGTAQNAKITGAVGDIADDGDGPLTLTVTGQGSGKDLLGFVRASPLGTKFAGPLAGVDVGGQGKVEAKMFLPYKHIEDFTLDGTAQLTDADLSDSKYGLKFDNASGRVRFDRSGLAASELATTFRDRPAKLSLAAGGTVADKQHAVEARVDARLPARDVMSYAPALGAYQKYITGEANWSAVFSADSDAKEGSGQRLVVSSDLRGVTFTLPAPLAKTAESALPLKLTLSLPFIGADVDARLGDIVWLRGRLPTLASQFVANVTFGGEASATLPRSGVIVGGSAREIDLSGWMDFASDGPSGDGHVLERVELRTPAFVGWDRRLGEGSVKLTSSAEATEVVFAGPNIDGTLTLPQTDLRQRGITADFKRLYWPEIPESEATPADGESSALNPAVVPPLHIRIADLHLGKANYGAATVETVPTADGMHFDHATTHSKNIDMRAHGDWTRRNGFHRSTFGIDLSAQNIGHMLDALGNSGLIDGGKTVAHIDASWPGTPSAFALRQINGGALKINIAE